MPTDQTPPRSWRTFVARHLFAYLAVLAGVVVVASAVFARDELEVAWRGLDVRWIPVVLGLTLFNYALRFWKWELLLRAAGIRVPRVPNALLYFACLAMVVTPARLGELYKLVFLRKLHGVTPQRSLPPLVLERVTDAFGVLALVAVQPFRGIWAPLAVLAVLAGILVLGWLLARPRWRALMVEFGRRVPGVRSRIDRFEDLLAGHAELLRPVHLAPALGLSALAWWAECLGLALICLALGSPIGVIDATWIYALSTLVGNLTFLPGGLVGTEASLLALLTRQGLSEAAGVGATALVRGATLWFAVVLGLVVTLLFRRRLQWDEVTAEATSSEVRSA